MKSALPIFVIILLAFVVSGCGLSNEQIGETVKKLMQEKFNSDPQFKEWGMVVTGVLVLKQGDSRYEGIAKITHEGTSHDVPVEITVDGNMVMWKTDPGAFMFVAQKEFQKLLR